MNLKNIFSILILLFIISTLIFPVFLANKFFFLIILAIMFYKIKGGSKMPTVAPIIVLAIFFYGFIMSFFGNVYRPLTNQLILSVALLLLIYPIQKYKIDMDRIVKISGIVLVALTGLFFLFIVSFAGNSISNIAYDIFTRYGAGSSGLRGFGEEVSVSFHFATVPFLYLPLCIFFHTYLKTKKISNILAILFILPAIFVSTSRGLWIICLLSLLVIYFFNLKLTSRLILFTISTPIFFLAFSYINVNTNAFNSDEESNWVKIGHITSFFDHINFNNFFFGDGLGSYYFTKGANGMKAETEITPLDMLRYFGFILTPLLYLVIIFPTRLLKSYKGENKLIVLIFCIYLINSFTNPIMFNSYGLIIVLWYWSKILDDKGRQFTNRPNFIIE